MKIHPDFDIPWCKALLSSNISDVEITTELAVDATGKVMNPMFNETLNTSSAVRAQLAFKRPSSEADSVRPWEYCCLFSVGPGVDGKTGRAHGGFNALILDQITGATASKTGANRTPATATMTVDYKAPVNTPGVVLGRAWAIDRTGRKTWVKAVIEDGQGRVLASAKALYLDDRPTKI